MIILILITAPSSSLKERQTPRFHHVFRASQRHLFLKKIRHFEELSSVASKVKEEEETVEVNTNARWRTTRSTLSSAWTR